MLGATVRAVARAGVRSAAARSRPGAGGPRAGVASPQVRGGHAARGRVAALEAEVAVGGRARPGPRGTSVGRLLAAHVHFAGDFLFEPDDDDGT